VKDKAVKDKIEKNKIVKKEIEKGQTEKNKIVKNKIAKDRAANEGMPVVRQCMVALGIVINIVGAFIALNLHLPVYLDSIGTVMISALYGPVYGIVTGLLGSLVSGFTFDIYSLYFAPVQIFTGFMAGVMFNTKWLKKGWIPLGSLAVSLPTSIASAVISAFVFGGITSSGSSIIVQVLTKAGVSLTVSCFVVQVVTDYFDKLLGIVIVSVVLRAMTGDMKAKLKY